MEVADEKWEKLTLTFQPLAPKKTQQQKFIFQGTTNFWASRVPVHRRKQFQIVTNFVQVTLFTQKSHVAFKINESSPLSFLLAVTGRTVNQRNYAYIPLIQLGNEGVISLAFGLPCRLFFFGFSVSYLLFTRNCTQSLGRCHTLHDVNSQWALSGLKERDVDRRLNRSQKLKVWPGTYLF